MSQKKRVFFPGPGTEVPLLANCAMNGLFMPVPILIAGKADPHRKIKINADSWAWSGKEQAANMMSQESRTMLKFVSQIGEEPEVPCEGYAKKTRFILRWFARCYNLYKTYLAFHPREVAE